MRNGHQLCPRTTDGRLDYFGQNGNIAARTEQLAGSGEILITEDILNDPGVSELLADATLHEAGGMMKGVSENISVFRIHPIRPAA